MITATEKIKRLGECAVCGQSLFFKTTGLKKFCSKECSKIAEKYRKSSWIKDKRCGYRHDNITGGRDTLKSKNVEVSSKKYSVKLRNKETANCCHDHDWVSINGRIFCTRCNVVK